MKFRLKDISVEWGVNGLILTIVYRDQFYHNLYDGYTVREAKRLFRDAILQGEA